MPVFYKKNNIVFDFGTGIVKAVIFHMNNKAEILKYAKADISQDTLFKSNYFQNDVLQDSFNEIYKNLEIKNLSQFQKCYFLLSGEYLKEMILTQKIIRDNPKEKISKQEEEKIKKTIANLCEKQILKNKKFGEIQFLKFRIFSIKIDGYQVEGLRGFSGKEIEFSIICVFSINDYFKKAKSFILSQKCQEAKFIFQSDFIINLADESNAKNLLIIDSGDKITRFYSFLSGNIVSIDEMDLGGRKITNDLAVRLNMEFLQAKAIKEKFFYTQIGKELGGEIKYVLENNKDVFLIHAKHDSGINIDSFENIYIFGGNGYFLKDFAINQKDKISNIEFKEILSSKEFLNDNIYHNLALICNYAKKENL